MFEVCQVPPLSTVRDSSYPLTPSPPQPANYLLPFHKQPSRGAILARLVKIYNKLPVKLLEEYVAFQESQTGFCISPWEMQRGIHTEKKLNEIAGLY